MAAVPGRDERLVDFHRQCTHCDRMVIWVSEDKGGKAPPTRFPVDVEPQDNGNLTLTASGRKVTVGRPGLLQAQGMRAAGVLTYLRHAALCPAASKWSKNTTGFGYEHVARGARRRG